jgi:hypothetical protein
MPVLTLLISLLLVEIFQDVSPVYPQAEITSPRMQVTVHLPDPQSGYYRGTRFDWSGAIASLRWRGHEYFGPWFEKHDPLLHDGITGPVEEFQAGESSVGYADAPVGGTFVRIGVGHVRKPEEKAYRRFATYEIVDAGKWTIQRGPGSSLAFVHDLGESNGYAYVYRKTLTLEGDTLTIDHSLRNTGRKRIETSVYNHNFFTLDRRPTDAKVSVTFPFEARPAREIGPLAAMVGRDLRFARELAAGETVFTELAGFGADNADYDFLMKHAETGAAVRIRSDRPLTKLIFWSAARTVCPEPYVDASVDPGQTTTWRITYDFSDVK